MEKKSRLFRAGAAVLFAFCLAPPIFALDAEEVRPGRMQAERNGGQERRREEARESALRRMRDIEAGRARLRERLGDEAEALRELAGRHRKAITEAERDALREEMISILNEGFERRHSALKERLEELKAECAAIEYRIKQNIERKDEIIEMRLERMLAPPSRIGPAPAREGNGRAKE